MKALEQAAAERFGKHITLIAYLYADNILTIKELTSCVNQARIMFINDMSAASKANEGDKNNE